MSEILTPNSKSIRCIKIQDDILIIAYKSNNKGYQFKINKDYAKFLIDKIKDNGGKNLNGKYINLGIKKGYINKI